MTNKNNNKNILVIGSLNMDFVIEVDKMPNKKETVHGNTFTLVPGGKGANEAYALGKMGANVTMLGAVGTDEYGKTLIENLKSVNVDTSKIKKVADANTGCAFINVDKTGENSITVVGGANQTLTKEIIDKNIKLIDESNIIVMQLEIPIDVVTYAAQIAKEKGKTVILDPAPAIKNIPDELLQNVDIIKPNEIEIEILTGIKIRRPKDLLKASHKLISKGVKTVITTLGSQGAFLVTKDKYEYFKAIKVEAVDTTAAGDSFIAALAKSLIDEKTIEDAIKYANIISSLVVTKKGAQTSIPSIEEIENLTKGEKKMEKIIIDADPGVDDAFAILLAANEKHLKIEAITTVVGNCSLEDATNNTFTILNLCNRLDIPVYKGCAKSLATKEVNALNVHGSNGLGGVKFDKVDKKAEKENAVDYLIKKVKENKGEIIITAIGPLTNIASAIKKDPTFASNVKSLVIMGGGVNKGNITKYAEFNFYKDPHAAKIVFESDFKEIIMMGLDVTTKLPLKEEYENMLKNSDENLANILYDITRDVAAFDRKKNKTDGAIINDPITIAHLIDKSIVKLKYADVEVVTDGAKMGRTNVNFVDKSNIKVAYDVDSDRFYDLLFSKILKNYKK